MKLKKKQTRDSIMTFRLNSNIRKWLDKVKKLTGLSRSEIINQLLAKAISYEISK